MGTVRLSHIAGSLPVKLCVPCVGALGSKVSNKHRSVDRQYTHNYHRKARSPGCTFRFDAKVGSHIQGIIERYIAQVRADPLCEIDPPSRADLIVAELTLEGKLHDHMLVISVPRSRAGGAEGRRAHPRAGARRGREEKPRWHEEIARNSAK